MAKVTPLNAVKTPISRAEQNEIKSTLNVGSLNASGQNVTKLNTLGATHSPTGSKLSETTSPKAKTTIVNTDLNSAFVQKQAEKAKAEVISVEKAINENLKKAEEESSQKWEEQTKPENQRYTITFEDGYSLTTTTKSGITIMHGAKYDRSTAKIVAITNLDLYYTWLCSKYDAVKVSQILQMLFERGLISDGSAPGSGGDGGDGSVDTSLELTMFDKILIWLFYGGSY